jgi:hypothetical protein
MTEPRPFEEPPNVATISTRHVIDGGPPVGFAAHDAEDGAWQVLPRCDVTMSDVLIIGLEERLALDGTFAQLADLPPGRRATPDRVGPPWRRARSGT